MRIFQPTVTGSNTTTGSLHISGPVYFYTLETSSVSHTLVYNTSSGQVFFTASRAVGLRPGDPDQSIQFNDGGEFSGSANLTFVDNVIYLTGSLNTSGSIILTGSFGVSGSTNVIGTSTITGSLNTSGSINTIGTSTITGSLNTSGSTNTIGTSTITGSLVITGSTTLTGSMFVTGAISASSGPNTVGFYGTASWAQNALTASFITASNVYGPFGSSSVNSASYASSSTSASFAGTASLAFTASFITGAGVFGPFGSNSVLSASYASSSTSASYALFSTSASYAENSRPAPEDTWIQYNKNDEFGAEQYFRYIYDSHSFQQGNIVTASGNYSHAQGYNTLVGWKGFNVVAISGGIIQIQDNVDYSSEFTTDTIILYQPSYHYAIHSYYSTSYNPTFGDFFIYLSDPGVNTYPSAPVVDTTVADTANLFSPLAYVQQGNYSHTEGAGAQAYGNHSHAEGGTSKVYGKDSHAEGSGIAYGESTHAEGGGTSYGTAAHAEGYGTALGSYSHAEGSGIAGAIGLLVTSVTNGLITISRNTDFSTLFPLNNTLILYYNNTAKSYTYTAVIYDNPNFTIQLDDTTVNIATDSYIAPLGNPSGAWLYGPNNIVSTIGVYSHAEGSGKTFGERSHAEGNQTITYGNHSHAEGFQTITSGEGAHAEGTTTTALGDYSHTEGYYTISSGSYSHAEGSGSIALGIASHAEGNNTIATGSYQLVVGQYNVALPSQSAFIIGDGTANNARHNVLFISKSWFEASASNVYFQGLPENTSSLVLVYDSSSGRVFYTASNAIGGTGTPAPQDTWIQYNSGSTFGATGSFRFIYTSQSFQQGSRVTASGRFSHAQGSSSIALGIASHTEGLFTIASGAYSTVVGQYNVALPSQSAFIIGDGFLSSSIIDVGTLNAGTDLGDNVFTIDNTVSPSSLLIGATLTVTGGGGDEVFTITKVTSIIGSYQVEVTPNAGQKFNNGSPYTISILIPARHNLLFASQSWFDVSASNVFLRGIPTSSEPHILSYHSESGQVYYMPTFSLNPAPSDTYIQYNSGSKFGAEEYFRYIYTSHSFQQGNEVTASGYWSHAQGSGSLAYGISSHAEGFYVTSSGEYSHAEGRGAKAIGESSHAEGNQTISFGGASHAEGFQTIASGSSAHAEGSNTVALGLSSHAEGSNTVALGLSSHAEGSGSIASGSHSHAEGYLTIASGSYSHAEGGLYKGISPTALGNYSHAEGLGNIASGEGSHAEGYETQAYGTASHAEGNSTITYGSASHAEGQSTRAIGNYSHAEGSSTETYADYSHTEGYYTIASGSYQTVVGQYNIANTSQSAFIIGDGTADNARHNVLFASQSWFEVSASNVYFQGLPQTSSNSILVYDSSSGQVFYTSSTLYTITASNGLTFTPGTPDQIKLGGILTQNTTINADNDGNWYSLNLVGDDSTSTKNYIFTINNDRPRSSMLISNTRTGGVTPAIGLSISSADVAINSFATGELHNARFVSNKVNALQLRTTSSSLGILTAPSSSDLDNVSLLVEGYNYISKTINGIPDTASITMIHLYRNSGYAPSNGAAGSIDYSFDISGNDFEKRTTRLVSLLDEANASNGLEGSFEIHTLNSNSLDSKLRIDYQGQLTLNKYTASNSFDDVSGTSVGVLHADNTGKIFISSSGGGGSGTITGITAGDGLSGGGSSGNITLALNSTSSTVGGAGTSYNIDHNFGTRNVHVTVYSASGTYETVYPDIQRPTTSSVTVLFNNVPAAGEFVVYISR